MTARIRTSPGADLRDDFQRILAACTEADAVEPFNEATRLGLAARECASAEVDGEIVGLAASHLLDDGAREFEVAVLPEHRGAGLGRALVDAIAALPRDGALVGWAHGDLAGARALADACGAHATRTLYVLGKRLDGELPQVAPEAGARIRTYSSPRDAEAWIALNARVFADHPEQGALTLDNLVAREREPWFDADDFLILDDADGTMIGYNWCKITDDEAEIYVIGIAPEAAGHGYARALMAAAYARIRERGHDEVVLYVDGENARAVDLYRRQGFDVRATDVQYTVDPRAVPDRPAATAHAA